MVKTGSSYCSQSELPLTFGLGSAAQGRRASGALAERAGGHDRIGPGQPARDGKRRRRGRVIGRDQARLRQVTKPVVDYTRRHLRLGWWSLLVFATLGLGLESLHGFKIRAYLDVSNETRRLMWTLAHAHGTLLAILNIVFGLSLRVVPELTTSRLAFVSSALAGATIVMPAAFFLGGIVILRRRSGAWHPAAAHRRVPPAGGDLLDRPRRATVGRASAHATALISER